MAQALSASYSSALPSPLTSFVGRTQELSDLKRLLKSSKLLTLTGVGGCGKTRLALEMTRNLFGEFEHDLCWVDLAILTDQSFVLQSIATAVGINEPTHLLFDSLLDRLKSRKTMLVLDGCEHLIETCAQLVDQLLCACSMLQVVTTSREALCITGEVIWQVTPLDVPDPRHLLSTDTVMQYSAVQLFVDRATAILPSFTLTREHIPAIVQVCVRLDGIPLAIELAAARMRVLSLVQIVARLDNCCRLLTTGSRTALPRHQTLQATIDWSYNLLSRKEQDLFCQLSVFPGSFLLETAEEVCAGEGIEKSEVLELLSRLVDKSLLMVEEQREIFRYRLLETTRQYSKEKLQKQGRKIVEPSRNAAVPSHLPQQEKGYEHDNISLIDLRIFSLGQVYVYRGRHLIPPPDWTYTKAKELLFYLLCHRDCTKEQIGLALWPDASPAQLRNSFHSTLHHLRRAFGRVEWIILDKGRYAFNRQLPYWFDVEVFEAHIVDAQHLQAQTPQQAISYLEEAVKLYRGDFLENILNGENWYLPKQKELRNMYLEALLAIGRLLFAQEQFQRAADMYRKLIACDNFLEAAHRELMRCYVRLGERSQALRHYHILATLIRDEFNASPALETTALFERLCSGDQI